MRGAFWPRCVDLQKLALAVAFLHAVVFCGVGEGRGVFNDSGGDLEIFKVGVTLLRNEDQDPTNPKLDNITDLGDVFPELDGQS